MTLPVRQTLKGRRAVVLGSTPACLSAAISLAARGASVVILEGTTNTGGALRETRLGDFQFATAPSLMLHPSVLAELFASAEHRLSDFITLERLNPIARIHLGEGRTLDVENDPRAFLDAVAAVAPEDAARLRPWLRQARTMSLMLNHRRQLQEVTVTDFDAIWRVFEAMPSVFQPWSTARQLKHVVRDEGLRRGLLGLRALTGVSPFSRFPTFPAYLWEQLEFGGWAPQGGTEALHAGLLRLCDLMDVKILKGVTVERLVLVDGKLKRVEGLGFKPLAASLAFADLPLGAMAELLPNDKQLVRKRLAQASRAPHAGGPLQLQVGASKTWDFLSHQNIFPASDPREESRFLDQWRIPALSNSLLVSCPSNHAPDRAPQGATALTVSCETALPHRFVWTEERLEEEALRIVTLLEKQGLKGIRANTIEHAIAPPTPAMVADVSSWPGLRWMQTTRIPELPGLYVLGAGVFPGPGLSAEIWGGMLAATMAAEDAK